MKKVLSFFLGIITCCLITFCAFAADNTDNIPSDAEVQAYASNFMTASQKNDNIGINEFIHLYSPDGTLTGYYVTFINNEDPAGYVLLSLISDEDPIVEFSFEGTGPITSAETEAVATTSAVFDEPEQDSAILYTGAGEIFIPTQEGTLYSVYDHEYVSADAEVATYSSGTDKGSGHCVMTLGYAKSTSGAKYLFVMDGWNNYGRFVKFNYYPYFFGYKIWVA